MFPLYPGQLVDPLRPSVNSVFLTLITLNATAIEPGAREITTLGIRSVNVYLHPINIPLIA
jgi:hypothetical protein